MATRKRRSADTVPPDPDAGPVAMPDLPPTLAITSTRQLKALADPTRTRILGIIQHQPATAKQIADRLGMPPGTIGHHLTVLEAAGLAQVVARRLVRGIVAKYYTRTARIFVYDLPPEHTGGASHVLDIITGARDELAESIAAYGNAATITDGQPRARLSPERLAEYQQRLDALIDDFVREPAHPGGTVHTLAIVLFRSPPYMQVSGAPADDAPPEGDGHEGKP